MKALSVIMMLFLLYNQPAQSQDIVEKVCSSNPVFSNSNELYFLSYPAVETAQQPIYWRKEWCEARILSYDDKIYPVDARFRTSDQAIEILIGNKKQILFAEKVKAIALDCTVFVPVVIADKKREKAAYFELLTGEKLQLLRAPSQELYFRVSGEPVEPIPASPAKLKKYITKKIPTLRGEIQNEEIELTTDELTTWFRELNHI